AGAACGDSAPAVDAAPAIDAPWLADASVVADAAASLSWVDVAVSGCSGAAQPPGAEPDAGVADAGVADAGVADAGVADAGAMPVEPCTGKAPLALRFAAVAPAAIDTHVWSFGDGTTS